MPNLANAKKALRQSQKKQIENLKYKKDYKKSLKDIEKAISSGQTDLKELVQTAQKKLDKAAKKGVLKDNTASRKLSRTMKRVNNIAK